MSYICTIAELRADGVPATYGDSTLTSLIEEIEHRWEDPRISGWWFAPRTKTYKFDGDDTSAIWCGVPIISLTSVTVDGVAQTISEFYPYLVTDDLENKDYRKITWLDNEFPSTTPQNVVVVGSFGCVNSDLTVPYEVNVATRRWVIRELEAPFNTDLRKLNKAVIQEQTLGSSRTYAPSAIGIGHTGDPLIDDVIANYRPKIR